MFTGLSIIISVDTSLHVKPDVSLFFYPIQATSLFGGATHTQSEPSHVPHLY